MVRSGSEATRWDLLHAAALEIAERGYSGASFSAVAARLGLTKGAFAYHFPTKQALAVALMENFGNAFTRAIDEAHEDFPSDDLRTALRALRTIEVQAESEPMVAAAFILMCDPQPPVAEIKEKFVWWVRTFKSFLTRGQENGQVHLTVPLDDAAEFLVISLLGHSTLSQRTLARAGAKERMHVRLLFTAIGVTDTEGLLTEVLGEPKQSAYLTR